MAASPEDAPGGTPEHEDGVTKARPPNLLDLTPRRNADWVERDGRIVLLRPRPDTRGLRGLGDWISYWLAVKKLRLDELGTHCWRQIDGRRNVWEIAAAMRQELGSEAEPAEERLGHFLKLLEREDLVRFQELER